MAAIYDNKPAGFPGVHFGTLHALCGAVAMGAMASAASSAMVRSTQREVVQVLHASQWSSDNLRNTMTY